MGLVLGLAAGDRDLDASAVQVAVTPGIVVTLVCVQLFRLGPGRPGGPRRPRTAGSVSGNGSKSAPSCVLPAQASTCSGSPAASVSKWYFVPGFPRSVGLGPVSSPPSGPYGHRVDASTLPVENLPLEELLEHGLVVLLPHPGCLPLAQPSPCRVPGPAAQDRRQVPPPTAGVEHEQDPFQGGPVLDPEPPAGSRGGGRGGIRGAISSHKRASTTHG